MPPYRRLAFRELGLTIGLAALEETWLDPRAQAASTWSDHLDITRVMLATSLVPDAYSEP